MHADAALREGVRAPQSTLLDDASWLMLALTTIAVVLFATVSGDTFPALAFAGLLAVGSVLFRRTAPQLFRLSLALNVLVALLLAAYFTSVRGEPFTAGGDDELFHDLSLVVGKAWQAGDWGAHRSYDYYSGYGYIVMGAGVYVLLSPLGEYGPIVIRMFGAFAGATLGPAIFLLGRVLLPERGERVWMRAGLAVAVFPTLVQYSALGLRDIYVAAAATWLMTSLAIARLEGGAVWRSWIAPAVIVAISSTLRYESALAMLAFWIVLLSTQRQSPSAMMSSAFVVLGAVVAGMFLFDSLLQLVIHEQFWRTTFAIDEAVAGSLGARILEIEPPLGYLARFVYALVIPVPPLSAFRPDTILIGLGATAWYFTLPLAASGIRLVAQRGAEHRSLAFAFGTFTLLLLAGVAISSIDLRHKLPIIPLGVLLAACAVEARDTRWSFDRVRAVALLCALLFCVYLGLKLR